MSALKTIVSATVLFMMAAAAMTADNDVVLAWLPAFYLAAILAAAYAVYDGADLVHAYFRPSSIMIFYCAVFFFMGSFAFKNELILWEAGGQFAFYLLDGLGPITAYFLSAIGVSLCVHLFVTRRGRTRRGEPTGADAPAIKPPRGRVGGLWLSWIIVSVTPFVAIPLPGGSGSFSATFFAFAAIHIAYAAKLRGRPSRIGIYGLLALILAAFFYDDRRLLFYFGLIVCFIEVFDKIPFRVRPRNVLFFAAVAAALVTTNIAMSIQRGVGDFGAETMAESFTYVDDYLASDWAQTMLFHNFEGPPAFFHSYNAAHYILETGDYRYGSTMVKILFLPLPRDSFPNKPRSMVDEYTDIHYPAFRARGGSFVPNFYAEAMWNFGPVGGLVFLFFFFGIADSLYCHWIGRLRRQASIDNVFFLASFTFLLFFYRGSGLDLYGLFVIIFYFLARVYRSLSVKRRRPVKKVPDLGSTEAIG